MHEQNPNISDARSQAIDAIAWSALLARWIDWARSSVALPDDAEGSGWKSSLPHLIALQAITHALDELPSVIPADRPLALERAQVSIRSHAGDVHACWAGHPLPSSILTIVDEAHHALARAHTLGRVFHVGHSGWIAPDPTYWATALVERGFAGDACAVMAGTLLAPGAPASWCADTSVEIPDIPGCALAGLLVRPQIYRQQTDDGEVRDICGVFASELLPGLPLMVPVVERGAPIYEFDERATHRWIEDQARAFGDDAPPLTTSGS
ncbi:MAG: hypothetical protein ACF8GE_09520 [Phycisphaerales bacterium JB043]